jgi:hypothetical protein
MHRNYMNATLLLSIINELRRVCVSFLLIAVDMLPVSTVCTVDP